MKKIKMSLRFNTFFSFFIVILIAFLIIFFFSRIFMDYYIKEDAKQKLNNSIDSANWLVNYPNTLMPVTITHYDHQLGENISITINEEHDFKWMLHTMPDSESAYISVSKRFVLWPAPFEDYERNKIAKEILFELQRNPKYADGEILEVNIDSSTYFASLVYFPDQPNPDNIPPYLLLYIDVSSYVIFAQNLYRTFIFVFSIALFMTFLASLFFSERITRSLHDLNRFASRIGSGNFEPQSLDFSINELDELARDMNNMAHKLSVSRQEQKAFFQNASHELRTPLMSIQGYAEGIKHNIFDDREAAIDIIISESERLSAMVDDLLTLSRLDMAASGLQNTPKTIINLNELLESIVEKIRGSILFTGKNLILHFTPKTIHIIGNENDLFRAFENILSNAIRHAENNIEIHTEIQSKNVCIRIIDDGPGIDSELLPDIFNRFVQGKGGNHGIGLSLAHAIIKDHCGKIHASNNSAPQKGACIMVQLPLVNKRITN